MNSDTPTRVLICGLNWSGSGAVFDLLKEYDEAVPISGGHLDFPAEGGLRIIGEFEMFRSPGFIADHLDEKDHLFAPNHAIGALKKQILSFRFKTVLFSFKLRRFKDILYTRKIYKQVVKTKTSLLKLLKHLSQTKSYEERFSLAKSWLEKVIEICDASSRKVVVFDQAIHLGQHGNHWPAFFKPFKLIIVHRDPRDVFAEQAKYHYLYRQQMGSNAISQYGDSLEDAIRYRVDVTLARMGQVDKVLSEHSSDEVMLLRFEDLVKNYDQTKQKIQDFIGLTDEDHTQPRKFFNPDQSIKNIGVFRNNLVDIPEASLQELTTWYNNH